MTKPDPRDFGAMLGYLVDRLDDLAEKTVRLIELYDAQRFSVSELASLQDCSPDTLYRCPWKLPRYGAPDMQGKRRLWLGATVRAWYARPEDERRREWESMSAAERRRAMGKSA